MTVCSFSTLSAAEGVVPVQADAVLAPIAGSVAVASAGADKTGLKAMIDSIDLNYELGRLEEAVMALESLLERYPTNASLWYRMGLLRVDMLNSEAAIQAYKKAVTYHLEAPALAYAGLAKLYHDQGRYPEAIASYESVIQLKPDDAYAWYMLAKVYMSSGDFPHSIISFKHAGAVDESYRQKALYGQGMNYLRLGDAEKAKSLFKACVGLDSLTATAALAKKGIADATRLENTSYFSLLGLYGFQFDSNVVLKPSTSPNIPLITGVTDYAHTFLSILSYAPPPASNGMGYKASTMVYANLHNQLSAFDIIALDLTVTPYIALNKSNVLSLDTSFGYIFFNRNRYMDTITLKPSLTYIHSDQLQLILSLTGNRANYYKPVVLQTLLQDGWSLTEDVKFMLSSTDRKYSFQLGGKHITNRTRGSDWSYNGTGGHMEVTFPVPYVDDLMTDISGSVERQKFQNLVAGSTVRRRDSIYDTAISITYPFTYANVSVNASYTHSVSNADVYSYVRVMTGINFSRSF